MAWLKGQNLGEVFDIRDSYRWVKLYGNATTAFAPSGFILQGHDGAGTRTNYWVWFTAAGVLRSHSSEPTSDAVGSDVGSGVAGANTALSNIASTAIPVALISDAVNTDDLGSDAKPWKSLYLGTSVIFDKTNRNLTLTASEPAVAARTINFPDPGANVDIAYVTTAQTLTNKTLTTPVIASMLYSAGGNAITFQDAVHTVIGRDTTDTLTNKTLSGNVAANFVYSAGGNAITFQDAVHTVIGRDTTDTLTNKSIDMDAAQNTVTNIPIGQLTVASQAQGDVIVYKAAGWSRLAPDSGKFLKSNGAGSDPSWETPTVAQATSIASNATIECGANDYTLNASAPAAARQLSIADPLGNDTFVFLAATQTLTNKTLTSPVLTTPQINDTSADHQYIFAVNELAADRTVTLPLLGANDEFVFKAFTQTLTNKTLTTPIIASIYQDAGKTQLMTLPNTASDTLAAIAATQTFTNKTLTSPVLTTPQINDTSADHQYIFAVSELAADRTVTLPLLDANDEFIFKTFAATLANKTLTTPVVASLYQDAGKTKLMTVPNVASDTLAVLAAAQTLTTKTIDADSNTITNIGGAELEDVALTNSNYNIPIVIPIVNAGVADIDVFSGVVPFKLRILDAWAVSTKAGNAGNWKLNDGAADLSDNVAYGAGDNDIARLDHLYDAAHTLVDPDDLHLINSNAADTAIVYVLAVRET